MNIKFKEMTSEKDLHCLDSYWDFNGPSKWFLVSDIADKCSYPLFQLKRFTLHGIPYKFNRNIYCSEMRDWKPPNLNKLGKEYCPCPFSLSACKNVSWSPHMRTHKVQHNSICSSTGSIEWTYWPGRQVLQCADTRILSISWCNQLGHCSCFEGPTSCCWLTQYWRVHLRVLSYWFHLLLHFGLAGGLCLW